MEAQGLCGTEELGSPELEAISLDYTSWVIFVTHTYVYMCACEGVRMNASIESLTLFPGVKKSLG